MKQRIFILGASGNVGRELVKQIMTLDGAGNHMNPSEIVGLANSTHFLFSPDGIKDNVLKKVISSQESAKKVMEQQGEEVFDLSQILNVVKNAGMDGEIYFADVTAGKEDLLQFHKLLLTESSNFLVTANKNPISLFSMEDFLELTAYAGRYNTNTTVMAGAGIVSFVYERTDKIKDDIKSLTGVFSGTLGYIMSELRKGKETFSQVVKKAKKLGYTEPNPWDDLNGLDVARKLVILARYSGYYIDINDVVVEPLISNKYARYKGEEFLEKIVEEDERIADLSKKAQSSGKILAYVGEIIYKDSQIKVRVGLKEVDEKSDIGMLEGAFNIVLADTQVLSSPMPHIIKSRGAGLQVTAASVRVGIARMLPHDVRIR